MPRCYTQITISERRRLYDLKSRAIPFGEIARLMGRHRSTIYREIRRNTFHDREFPEYSGYYDVIADKINAQIETGLSFYGKVTGNFSRSNHNVSGSGGLRCVGKGMNK